MATTLENTASNYAEIARQSLVAEQCALLVVDIQEKLLPPIDREFFFSKLGRTYPAVGERRARVALFAGCVAQVSFSALHDATIRVLTANGCELLHQRLVDVQASCRVEDHDVAAVLARAVDALANRLDRVAALVGVNGNVDLRAELDQLVDRGRALQVGSDERGLAAVLLQQQSELAGRGRLSRSLQPRKQDRRRRPLREGDLRRA